MAPICILLPQCYCRLVFQVKTADMKKLFIAGTADTKGDELRYLLDLISPLHGGALVVDVGTGKPAIPVSIASRAVADYHPKGAGFVLGCTDRGAAVQAMGTAFAKFMATQSDVAGIIGIGGGGGTSIITAGMRELPLGIPKIMVSTLASGDVAPFVGISDIVMMPSVTDMAGLNRLSRVILGNAARAIAAMAAGGIADAVARDDEKPAIGLTMFGVTTDCVTAITKRLGNEFDCMVFHATGTGGRTMEKLADSGMLSGMIDITTTEVCDLLLGGVLPATEDRFGAAARTGLPLVCSTGALDMVNFWGPDSVPDRYRQRQLYRHNANVTLMRTTARECTKTGEWIANKLNLCNGEVRVLLPEKGVSALDIEGGAFHDSVADEALFQAIENTVRQTASRKVIRVPYHINDEPFAEIAVREFRQINEI